MLAKFHGNMLNLSENIAKSFRGLLFWLSVYLSLDLTPDPEDFQNLTGLPCPTLTSMINFQEDPISFSKYMSQIQHLAMKNPSKHICI